LGIKKAMNIKVIFSFLNANKKSLLLKAVTLTLVTISITCSFFFLDSFRPQFSRSYMSDLRANQNDLILSFDFPLEDYLGNGSKNIDELFSAEQLANNFSFHFKMILGNNSLLHITTRESTYGFYHLEDEDSTITIVNVNNFALEQLDAFSSELNSSVSLFEGAILILSQSLLKYSPSVSALFNKSSILLSNGFADISTLNYTLDFHSKISYDFGAYSFSDNITKIIGQTNSALVVSDAIFKDYLKFINASTSLFEVSSGIHFDIDYSTISFDNEVLLKDQLYQFLVYAQDFIYEEYSLSAELSIDLKFLSFLNDLNNTLFIINILILIFTVPIILFSFIILRFSNDFFATKRSKLFSFYYSKGSSIKQLFFFVFSENVLALILALMVGVGLSFPLTILMVDFPSFLGIQKVTTFQIDFSFAINPIKILWIVQIITILSLLLVFIDFKPILSQKTVPKDLEIEDKSEQRIASWRKFYFDFLLLFAGFGILLLERILFQSSSDDFITQFFIYFFGILVIIVAVSLLFLRFTPNLLSSIGNYLWQKFGGFFSFTTRLFNTRKKGLARNILFFVLCVSYLLSLIQMISAINQFSTEQAYFTIGADARVDFISSESNITAISSALPTSIHSTEVIKLQLENQLTGDRLVFYSIDTDTFLSAAYFNDNFIVGDNPSHLMEKIALNMSFLVARGIAEEKSWNIGYNYSFTLTSGSTNRTSLQIVDYFLAWPFFVDEDTGGFHFIIGEDTRQVLQEYSTATSYHLLLNFPENVDYLSISNYLKDEILTSNEELVTVNDGYEIFWDKPFWIVLNTFSIVNVYLISLFFILFSIITTITLENNRKAEIGLFHALGLSKRQIFFLSFSEQFIIFFFGFIFGIALGLPSSIFLNNKLQSNLTIPIETINVYWYVGLVLLGIVILNLIANIYGALYTSTRKISFFIQELEIQNELDD